jgi:hypothetical protein
VSIKKQGSCSLVHSSVSMRISKCGRPDRMRVAYHRAHPLARNIQRTTRDAIQFNERDFVSILPSSRLSPTSSRLHVVQTTRRDIQGEEGHPPTAPHRALLRARLSHGRIRTSRPHLSTPEIAIGTIVHSNSAASARADANEESKNRGPVHLPHLISLMPISTAPHSITLPNQLNSYLPSLLPIPSALIHLSPLPLLLPNSLVPVLVLVLVVALDFEGVMRVEGGGENRSGRTRDLELVGVG